MRDGIALVRRRELVVLADGVLGALNWLESLLRSFDECGWSIINLAVGRERS